MFRERLAGLAVVAGILTCAGCGERGVPAPLTYPLPPTTAFMKGMTEAAYQVNVLNNPQVYASLPRLRRDGVNWISLQVAWYQTTDRSNRIFPDPRETPTDASVTRFIRYVNGLGMRVFLDVFVNANRGNAWQAVFHPSNPQAWFQSYDRYLVHYAKLAAADRVSLFAIGDEFDSLDDVPAYTPYWTRAIADVRRYYHGPVTYGANYTHYQRITFWKQLNMVGLDAYFPLSSAARPTTPQLVSALNRLARQIYTWRQRAGLTEKPFVITELGYFSGNGTAKKPGDWRAAAPVNLQLQKQCYQATFQTIYRRRWLRGIFWFWWANPSNPHWQGGPADNGYTPRNKPAEKVLRAYFTVPRSRWFPAAGK